MTAVRGGLTLGQQALWHFYRQDPAATPYLVYCALRGEFDEDVLARAVRIAGGRHDLVRSTFAEDGEGPYRTIHDSGRPVLEVRDAPGLTGTALRDVVLAAGREPFRLEDDGAFRVVLVQGAVEQVLLVAGHHIATDAISQCLLVRHIIDAYADLAEGRAPDETRAPSFERQVERERALLAGPRLAELERYWRQVCEGAAMDLELPVDRPRPRRPAQRGRTHVEPLGAALTSDLKQAAARAGTTQFALLLTAFRLLLHRYTGETDLVIGCPTATRRVPGLRATVGYYVNPLVLRATIAPDDTCAELVLAAHDEIRRAMAHHDYPFPLLPTALGVPRDAARSPVFQITFTMVATGRLDPVADLLAGGVETLRYRGLRLAAYELDQQEGQFDLAVEVMAGSEGTKVLFRYRDDLYEPETIRRLGRHYVRLLEALPDALPDAGARPAASLPAVDAGECAELLALGRVRS
ncbi:condensation domain-containing protein [Actinomadura violacea]|uniref:Condensation domain-containing protein n=1 Tax=Actinomadura violacea TaxID=2819934 RepID=A0ABS3RNH6_9ACTN|nr:condensation domain-containing protein [Actinomadura violacea]MBO2458310.1 hypothetical protein [Actinomadura violacea]